MMSIKKIISWIKNKFKRPGKPPVKQPLFVDTFTQLDVSKWIVSSWSAPMGGKFSPNHVFVVDGMLCLKLTQTQTAGIVVSTGSEIATRQSFGYGTYEFEVKASSDNPDPNSAGSPVSGSVTGCFNYGPSSSTEIDVEIEGGSRSALAQFTSWKGDSNPNEHTSVSTLVPPHAKFYTYKFVWTASSIIFFIDGVQQAKHTKVIPTTPAPFLFNHWGTDDANWGGIVTIGTDRYMFVKRFQFTPL